MIESPFIEQVYCCKNSMKKLRKKIYKFNINKQQKIKKSESTIKDALTVLSKRNIPQFLLAQLSKYSDLTFSSLSGFSLGQVQPLNDILNLTNNQQKQIEDIYLKNKKNLKKRRTVRGPLKLQKRPTSIADIQVGPYSQTNDSDIESLISESSQSQDSSDMMFEPIHTQNDFGSEYYNQQAMFQSTILDFQNEVDMDSEEFLFKQY